MHERSQQQKGPSRLAPSTPPPASARTNPRARENLLLAVSERVVLGRESTARQVVYRICSFRRLYSQHGCDWTTTLVSRGDGDKLRNLELNESFGLELAALWKFVGRIYGHVAVAIGTRVVQFKFCAGRKVAL